jgi:hypothetical protein
VHFDAFRAERWVRGRIFPGIGFKENREHAEGISASVGILIQELSRFILVIDCRMKTSHNMIVDAISHCFLLSWLFYLVFDPGHLALSSSHSKNIDA